MEDRVNTVMFICNRTACKDCHPECKHTSNVEYAKSFKKEVGTIYAEKEEKTFSTKLIGAAMALTITVGILALGFRFVTWLLF
ncbi:MAG: hypothetical protein PHE09_11080 [Oscillospiraceae bacterium]|nr:hypothetical protein [Oscillospiraceae bacterium]